VGWIVFLALALPLLAIFGWMILSGSVVHIPAGRLGLLLIRGRATDQVLAPGPHWVPALRRRMVEEYPSLELSYRAVPDLTAAPESGELERSGPAPQVTLGDRTELRLGYTVRFRLDENQLRSVHERFGPEGIWPAVRDLSTRAVRGCVSAPDIGVDDLFGPSLVTLAETIGAAVAASLAADGLTLTMFALGDVDLGRTGDVIQSTVRARLENDREEAESTMRLTRARIDAELEPYLTSGSDAALRYREVDVWRDLAHTPVDRIVASTPRPSPPRGTPDTSERAPEVEPDNAEAETES
jgi:SPFH domain / Band 7 family